MPQVSLLAERMQKKAVNNPAIVRPLQTPIQIINGRIVPITDNQNNYITKGYNINDIVYSIVSMIMDKIRVAPWSLYTVKDEQAMKTYQAMQQRKEWLPGDFKRTLDFRTKAIEPVKNTGKIGEVLKYANEYETFPEFVANGCGYKMLIGNKYIWANVLEMGANKGAPQELWNLPAQWMQITASDTFPSRILEYIVMLWPNLKFKPEEILHEKKFNPNWNVNGEQHYGISPLKSALRRLNRNNSAMDAATSAFQNEGIKGILHMKADPNSATGDVISQEVKQLKKTMVTEWVGESNYGKMGISGYDMGWLPIGLSSKEMQQVENEKWDAIWFCNLYGLPPELLGLVDKTYNNVKEATKALTVRCAIPYLNEFRDSYNRKGWGLKPGEIIDYDQSVFSELQEDVGEMMKWVQPLMNMGFPLNRALELMNLEKIDNVYYDEPRVTTTMGESFSEHEMTDVESLLIDES